MSSVKLASVWRRAVPVGPQVDVPEFVWTGVQRCVPLREGVVEILRQA
jgi:hypothetical protein